MKKIVFLLFLLQTFLPTAVYALECKKDGLTVVYVNGILTNKRDAQDDTDLLRTKYEEKTRQTSVNFLNGYNQTHLAGGADIVQTAAQAFGTSITDFDQNTILMQIQPQVTTRKILLVGHSQGTFYTNSIYKYLTEGGVPEESIAVYNLATPASYVEGGGKYLTSANDRVINGVRPLMAKYGAPAPLSANITIAIPENETNDPAGGHHFGSSYLAMEPDRIVSDITNALGGLKARASSSADPVRSIASNGAGGCFTPPPKTLKYKAQEIAFKAADPVAQTAKENAVAAGSAIAAAARKAAAAAAYATAQIKNAFSSLFKSTPKASAANQGAAAASALTTAPVTKVTLPAKTASVSPTAPLKASPLTGQIPAKSPAPPAPPPPAPPPPPIPAATQVQNQIPQTLGPALVSVVPGFGGGGAPPAPAAPSPVVEVPPLAPVIVPLSVQTPPEGALFATSSVTFSGTTTPSYSVVASYASTTATTSADSNGNWSVTLALPEGATAIGIVATDSNGNTSNAITRTIHVDATAPSAPAPSVAECPASLSSSFCLIPTTSASLSWPAVSGASYYAYAVNGAIIATTTGTGATLSLSASASSTISVASYDQGGNAATSTTNVYVLTQPLIINEVAWAGTLADSTDEWIELKNSSSYALDLSRAAVVSTDGSPYIQLSGAIAEGGYYLIERRAEATSATGDLVLSFGQLSNDGEELSLKWGSGSATTTIDATPAVSTCGGWCSGIAGTFWGPVFTPHPMTMERKTSTTDGTAAASWQNGTSTIPSATDSSGNNVSGTPRTENSGGGELPLPPGFPFPAES